MKKTLTFLAILFIWPSGPIMAAEPLTESEATPSVMTETAAEMLITEVSFKNGTADWVEIYYSSPAGNTLNINGISFADDSVFKTVEDFTIQANRYFILTFKSSLTDSFPNLYTARTGLTGTTEQIIIYDKNGAVLDAVCWTSTEPTTSEIADMANLAQKNGWISASPSSCINSEQIDNNVSIIRGNFLDSDSANDWLVAPEPTPAAANIYEHAGNEDDAGETRQTTDDPEESTTDSTSETGTTEEGSADDEETAEEESGETTVEEEISTGPGITLREAVSSEKETKTARTTTMKTTAKNSTKKTSAKYSNGDLSENIIISEIMPNPEGTDTKNEWIEIYNSGADDVNLGNWSLDDEEGGSKPFVFSDQTVITAGGVLLIPITDSKISLSNTQDSVRLFDYEGTPITEIAYEEAPSGQSYAYIAIDEENGGENKEWIWQKSPTPGETNPLYREMTGRIITPPQKENPYTFQITDSKEQTQTIQFDEETLPAPLAIASLIKDSIIKMILEQKDKDWKMIRYEIVEPVSEEKDNGFVIPSIIGSILTATGSAYYFLRKRIKLSALFNIADK